MLITSLALLVGFVGLLWSADRFISGAAATARIVGMPPMLIGITVVSIGTSAPELMVSASAAMRQAGEVAIGNAIGSNLANVGLVLGVTALIAPIPVSRSVPRRELPLLLLVTALAALLFADTSLSRVDGILLLAGLVVSLYLLVRPDPHGATVIEADVEIPDLSLKSAMVCLLLGLMLLVASAELLVWAAVQLALSMGVSQLVVGLTVIAVGTSLPELAASGMCAWKGHHDIALGNILGSNFFNLLGVTAVASLIEPLPLDPQVLTRDYAAMTLITVMLALLIGISWLVQRRRGGPVRIGRRAGVTLLICYASYYYFLFPQVSHG